MADRINYKDAEQALEEFLDSCYTVSHSSATVNGYKNDEDKNDYPCNIELCASEFVGKCSSNCIIRVNSKEKRSQYF